MHLRAASSPSTASKSTPARSESAKPTSKATASGSSGRRTSSLTSSELPRPSRRHSAQVAASTRQADKENAPAVDRLALDMNIKAGGGQEPAANVKIEMSTSSNSTKTKIAAAAATALKPKSSNVKAFQSTVSPLMHFDEPAPVPTALFSGLAISAGGVSPSHDSSSSSTTRSFSGPAALQQQHAVSANYVAQQSGGYLSVPASPAPFYNPATGFGVSTAAVYNPAAAAAYYYPTDFSAFYHHPQGYSVPSPPGTPLSTSTGAVPSSSVTTTTGNNNTQQQQQLYPPSLGLGHPYWYTPATTTPSSTNTSLSLSSVAASSLGLSPANSRSTSASSVASAGGIGGANKLATPAAAAVVYPIPYAYSTPFVAAPAVPAPSACGEETTTTTIRERLEGGAVLSSRGACKFFDVEKGFGFIIDDHAEELGADVFIHYTGIEQTRGFRCLAQHERVEYALVKHSSGRFQALKLRGENGAPLKGLDDPRQAAAFDRMNCKAAAIWSEDEENVCPPGKGRHRRGGGYAPAAYYKGKMRAAPPRIRRTPAEEEEDEDEGDSCVELEE
ncbi:hypothetical protein JCM8115_006745 [Rhodotorula mucilaginosa]|nr:hypothetical protein B0A53_01947 [Rhodotorula sp. CCFEE 5036]